MAKLIDKMKGPKTAPPVATTTKKSAAAKARKMGARDKIKSTSAPVPCSQGHPTQIVHFNYLRNMRRWCPSCLEVI